MVCHGQQSQSQQAWSFLWAEESRSVPIRIVGLLWVLQPVLETVLSFHPQSESHGHHLTGDSHSPLPVTGSLSVPARTDGWPLDREVTPLQLRPAVGPLLDKEPVSLLALSDPRGKALPFRTRSRLARRPPQHDQRRQTQLLCPSLSYRCAC